VSLVKIAKKNNANTASLHMQLLWMDKVHIPTTNVCAMSRSASINSNNANWMHHDLISTDKLS
jgi:hypothetical protein